MLIEFKVEGFKNFEKRQNRESRKRKNSPYSIIKFWG